jgi:hypothetical protein
MDGRWVIGSLVLAAGAALAVATASAQDAGTGGTADAPATAADAAAARPATTRRVSSREHDPTLVGGWVASRTLHRNPDGVTTEVDDLVLGANGDWTRRRSIVGTAGDGGGLAGEPESTGGTWFTETAPADGTGGATTTVRTLVLLRAGSAVVEELRSAYDIGEPWDILVLRDAPGGFTVYFRYR